MATDAPRLTGNVSAAERRGCREKWYSRLLVFRHRVLSPPCRLQRSASPVTRDSGPGKLRGTETDDEDSDNDGAGGGGGVRTEPECRGPGGWPGDRRRHG